jgi:signal transduction histidine kinase
MAGLCEELLRLTRSYLDYAGLKQGTRPLCFGTYTISALAREIDRQFGPAAASRRIGWTCALEGKDASVTTDASRCQQIFGNLVANALKYTPEGGEVRVSARVDRRHWVVTVADTGPGIPAEHVERVFEPFFRLPRDEQSRADGNGLGLPICREMVGQLGGTVMLLSGPGLGTRAVVEFPIDASAKAAMFPPPRTN